MHACPYHEPPANVYDKGKSCKGKKRVLLTLNWDLTAKEVNPNRKS